MQHYFTLFPLLLWDPLDPCCYIGYAALSLSTASPLLVMQFPSLPTCSLCLLEIFPSMSSRTPFGWADLFGFGPIVLFVIKIKKGGRYEPLLISLVNCDCSISVWEVRFGSSWSTLALHGRNRRRRADQEIVPLGVLVVPNHYFLTRRPPYWLWSVAFSSICYPDASWPCSSSGSNEVWTGPFLDIYS